MRDVAKIWLFINYYVLQLLYFFFLDIFFFAGN